MVPDRGTRLILHNGAPTWGGWLFVAMGLGAFGWGSVSGLGGLTFVGLLLGGAGAIVVVRRHRREITLDAGRGRLIVVDSTRFGSTRRVVSFGDVARVGVEAWTDPDPDARPFQQTVYRVVAHLQDGTELALTDFAGDRAATDRRRAHPPRRPRALRARRVPHGRRSSSAIRRAASSRNAATCSASCAGS
jgi:hypothetical protein